MKIIVKDNLPGVQVDAKKSTEAVTKPITRKVKESKKGTFLKNK